MKPGVGGPVVLVTDGEQRAALAIVRSLGSAGFHVEVVSREGRSLAGASRHARGDHPAPDPLRDPGSFTSRVASIAQERMCDLLIPTTEPSLLSLLSVERRDLPTIPFPDLDIVQAACDKAYVTKIGGMMGLGVPDQRFVSKAEVAGIEERADRALVVKPTRSISRGARLTVTYLEAGDPLRKTLEKLPAESFPLLLQQRIEGPGTGVFLLRWDGQTVAAFAHRRLREKPPSGGVSVLRESIALDRDLKAKTEALLEALQWHGVAMVEFKEDRETGVYYLMEVNPRFWGSLQLAIDAGVDFPRILAELALGGDSRPSGPYRIGVRSRWLLGDLDHLLLRLIRSPGRLNLSSGAPGRIGVMADFIMSFINGGRSEVFRWSDPRPFGRELGSWVRSLGSGSLQTGEGHAVRSVE